MAARNLSFAMAVLAATLAFPAGAASPDCLLCAGQDADTKESSVQDIPLRITVTTKLSFSRLALTGQGSAQVALDPGSGERNVGGDIIGLGGYPAAASVSLTGTPGRSVRIDLPSSIRMYSSKGGEIQITDIRSTLPASPRLDANGRLEFAFGGKLQIAGNMSGAFRGRIPITANYE